MTRWRAASIHFAISIVVIAVVGLGLVLLWYGWAFFQQMGGGRQLLILAIIDITIGPLLTLIVYKKGKPSLKFDLFVIAILQIGFLVYGLNIMAQSRPVFLVAVADRFELVFANELHDSDLAKGKEPRFARRSWTGPVLAGGDLGTTNEERMNLAISAFGGKDVHLLPERYVDYSVVTAEMIAAAEPAQKLADTSPQAADALNAAAQKLGRPLADLATLAIASRRAQATMVVDPVTAEPLLALAIDPWATGEE